MSQTCRARVCGKSHAYVGMIVGISLLLGGCRIERHIPAEKDDANVTGSGSGAASSTDASSPENAHSSDSTEVHQEAENAMGAAGSGATSTPLAASVAVESSLHSENKSSKEKAPQQSSVSPQNEESRAGAEPTDEDELSVPPEVPTIPEGWELLVFAGGSPLSSEIREFAWKSVGHGDPTAIAAKIVARLETLPSTNAGPGSALRLDGETIEASAVVLDGGGRSAMVGGVRQTLEPVMLAESLYRAGGGAIWGSAADELAVRFELRRGSLEISRARADYLVDLSSAVQAGLAQQVGTLFSLYVKPEALTESLSVRSRRSAQDKANRLPIFALVVAPDSRSAIAVSHGGEPLALPGSRSSIEQAGRAVALKDSSAAIVFAQAHSCEYTAAEILDRLQMTRSLALAAQPLESACADARYLVFSRGGNRSNLESESMLQISGRAAEMILKPASAVPSLNAPAPVLRPALTPARASGAPPVAAPQPPPTAPAAPPKPAKPVQTPRAAEVTP